MKEYIDEDSSDLSRLLLLLYVLLSLILCGGSVFGFTALKDIFLDEGVYEEMCDDSTTPPPCQRQLYQLDHMFTIAASLFSTYLLPAGMALRYLGPRTCFLTGFGLVSVGSLVFCWDEQRLYYTPAYVMIGTGNPLLYIAAFNFGKLYPSSSNLLLSIFIGCFGFSSSIFYVFNVLHFRIGGGGWSSQQLFGGFAIIPILMGIVGWFILPPYPYHVQREMKLKYQKALHDEEKNVEQESTETTPLMMTNGSTPAVTNGSATTDDSVVVVAIPDVPPLLLLLPLKERPILQQLQSRQFVAQAMFFCWGMLHQNFYLGTIGDQIFMYANRNPSTQEEQGALATIILSHFGVLYPIGCILSIVPVGTLVRNCSVSTSLFVYSGANLCFSILCLVPLVSVQWITSGLYVVVRVGFFTVMSTYSATLFGFANLGTMFGCAGCLAGFFSLLGTQLSDRALQVDHSFVPVDSLLLVGAVLNFIFPLVMAVQKW
jgi:hypothetical protein